MKIAVTGAAGQLGSELCRQLGPEAVPLTHDTLDLTRQSAVLERILGLRPDAVINCAAYTRVDQAESEPQKCRAVNVTAVEYLAGACGEIGCPLVQISTACVFSGADGRTRPYREDDPPSAQGVYAQTKLDAERAVARHVKHLIVRTCGLYAAPTQSLAGNFVKTILHASRCRKTLRVVSDRHCTPSYVPHVARAVLFLVGRGAVTRSAWGTYHVTNRGATTWYGFAQQIVRHAGLEVTLEPITAAAYGAAAPRPAYSVLDTAAYHRLGGPAMPDWQSALAEYFGHREHARGNTGSSNYSRHATLHAAG